MSRAVAEAFARRAEALVGTRFRLHGRDPATGLDCVGLVGAALATCGRRTHQPQGYRLRNDCIQGWMGFAEINGLRRCTGPVRRGDVILTRPGPAQHHLLVALGAGRFVHAHAGLRRVVTQALTLPQPPPAHWRLDPVPEHLWQR